MSMQNASQNYAWWWSEHLGAEYKSYICASDMRLNIGGNLDYNNISVLLPLRLGSKLSICFANCKWQIILRENFNHTSELIHWTQFISDFFDQIK